jgi:hypothetical protein
MIKHTIRVPEYAKAKKVSPMHIRTLIHTGVIPAIIIKRLILIDPDEADAALEHYKRKAVVYPLPKKGKAMR